MGDINKAKWYLEEVKNQMAKHGAVRPRWIEYPEHHPYSMFWRMGGGESYVMVFWTWFGDNFSSFEEKVQFFRKYPPPPRWMSHMAEALWDLKEDDFLYFEKSPYLEELQKLGFEGTEKYLEDLEDPKWLS